VALNAWFWNQPFTGSGQYLRRLVAAMHRLDPAVQLTLVMPDPPADPPDGAAVHVARASRSDMGKVWFEQVVFPRAAARLGAAVAHVPYWGAPLTSSVPLVCSILDVIPLALPVYAAGWKARAYVALQRAAARGTAHTLTISEASKADIVQYLGLTPDAVTVTLLAADEAYHPRIGRERDAAVKARYRLPDRFVLYLGGYDARKNLVQLLDAFAVVAKAEGDEVALVMAGAEPAWREPMFPDVRAMAAERGIADALQWIGPVAEADKPSLYRLARVFAYPSLYEGFGLPMLEAMASGTPVVANQMAVMEEIGGDAAFLIEPDSSRAMAGALLALLNQDPLHENLSGRGTAQATRFAWRKTARATLDAYRAAAAQAARSGE
jgi:glycosyltransferase involved in cell wall biosynthesis